MPDTVMDPLAGPDGMFDTSKPPSRGQWQTLAVLACRVLRLKVPTSRYEATLAIVRLRHELDRQESQGGAFVRRDIPDLSGPPRPLAYATVVAEALADLEAIEQAERELETELEERDRRRLERDADRDRRWAPPWRCDRCHKYVSSARSVCTCGHVGASNDEGHRTSYQRAHARRQARRRSR